MKLSRLVIFSCLFTLVMAGCLIAFSYILLNDVEYYNFRHYVFPSIILKSFLYGLFVFLIRRYVQSTWGVPVTLTVVFIALYVFAAFQIAFDARGDFGATWLSIEVFWELFVQKGKGFYLLLLGLMLNAGVLVFYRKFVGTK